MSDKTRARFDRYDPDVLEIMDELGQQRRRANRSGRTMAEQAEHDAKREAEWEATRQARPRSLSPAPVMAPPAGGATGYFLDGELDPARYDR